MLLELTIWDDERSVKLDGQEITDSVRQVDLYVDGEHPRPTVRLEMVPDQLEVDADGG